MPSGDRAQASKWDMLPCLPEGDVSCLTLLDRSVTYLSPQFWDHILSVLYCWGRASIASFPNLQMLAFGFLLSASRRERYCLFLILLYCCWYLWKQIWPFSDPAFCSNCLSSLLPTLARVTVLCVSGICWPRNRITYFDNSFSSLLFSWSLRLASTPCRY